MVIFFSIGKDLVDALITEGQDANAYLENEPRTTLNYVEYLNFLDKITIRVWYIFNLFKQLNFILVLPLLLFIFSVSFFFLKICQL